MDHYWNPSRRSFLGAALCSTSVALGAVPTALFSAGLKPLMLLLDGVTKGLSPEDAFAFLDPILSSNIPVGILLRMDAGSDTGFEATEEILNLIINLSADYPGLLQFVLFAPGLADLPDYLRTRRASDAQSAFLRFSARSNEGLQGTAPLLTIATDFPVSELPEMDGLRAAGFRSVLLLPEGSVASSIWLTTDGVQQVQGGVVLPQGLGQDGIMRAIADASPTAEVVLITATIPTGSGLEDDAFFKRGAELADAISRSVAEGDLYQTLPADLIFRSGDSFQRHIVLCVTGSKADDDDTQPIWALLDQYGLKYTSIRTAPLAARIEAVDSNLSNVCWLEGADPGAPLSNAVHAAFAATGAQTGDVADQALACVALEARNAGSDIGDYAGLNVLIDLSSQSAGTVGLDRNGIMRLSPLLVFSGSQTGTESKNPQDGLNDAFGPLQDGLVVIRSEAITNAEYAESIVSNLASLDAAQEIVVTDVAGYLRTVTVNDQSAELLKAAQRIPQRPLSVDAGAPDRASLLESASIAWTYFTTLTDPKTGLVPSTAWLDGDTVASYDFSTMWDVGTVILATISAHSIGLLDTAGFEARLTLLLANIPETTVEGLKLPKAFFPTDGTEGGQNGFNASDSARLLTALKVLSVYSTFDFKIDDMIAQWDFAAVIQSGEPQTISEGRRVGAYNSNYAGYIYRGFNEWGFDVACPYPESEGLSGMDADVATLHAAATLGPISTEPHLLEAVELGYSDHARAIAEALFAAQVGAYEKDGKLYCISEGPIDREPWFVYPGFQLGQVDDPWTLETLNTSPRYATPGFKRSVSHVSAKAAFLWHVVRSGDYTTRLVDHVRQNAQVQMLGYSPGVSNITDNKLGDYADINTNGIILQAIAFALNNGRAATEWRAQGPN